MKWDLREPCKSCPYRRDTRVGFWHPEEFDNLQAKDRDPIGSVFGCHGTIKHADPSVCIGWLLDQKRRGLPSLVLRVRLAQDAEARGCHEEATDGGHALYDSIEEMVAANEVLGRCIFCGRYRQEDETCTCPGGQRHRK